MKIAGRIVAFEPWPLMVLGGLSLAGYRTAVVGLAGTSQRRDVLAFLLLFAGLFALYAAAIALARRVGGGRTAAVVLVWALLFRLALLPAGLAPESWRDDLAADLGSHEVGYRTFLLYDNDVWRYLWDGHVTAAGIAPYAHSPSEIAAVVGLGFLPFLATLPEVSMLRLYSPTTERRPHATVLRT